MKVSPLFWPVKLKNQTMLVLDETLLPAKFHFIKVRNTKQAVAVIKDMRTRAFGQFLVVMNTFLLVLKNCKKCPDQKLFGKLQETAEALNASRPTFPFSEVTGMVLGWAKKAIDQNVNLRTYLSKNIQGFLHGIYERRIQRVQKIASLIKNGDTVLTHCNVSGELAMAAAICKSKKKKVHYFATETRPYFQGAKLTCWELQKVGVDVTLVADNAVGTLLSDQIIDLVIVGSDRSCANGDIANKIGTLPIAVCAKEFGVPMYVLTQPSTKIKKGSDIPIEVRNPKELLVYEGQRIAPKGTDGFYPGFDVVPNKFIKETIPINVH
ncbi:MAG: S-methyl-5-thioribose-1-phosphate isomerase [Candidatus Omnitrophota bacterium]